MGSDDADRRGPVLDRYRRASAEFDRRVHAIAPDQWTGPTPCADWDVRTLVNHLVAESLWVTPLMDGRTVAEVGTLYDGDVLGDDPVTAWTSAASAAVGALAAADSLADGPPSEPEEHLVHVSFGTISAADYAWQLTSDLTIHAWDLARGIDDDDRLDAELVADVLRTFGDVQDLSASGVFGPPVRVADDADPQTRLLAITGRDRSAALPRS